MPTLDELKQYLTSIGQTAPDFMLLAWLDSIAPMAACLAGAYPASVGKLIALYTLGLYALAAGDRRVSSQSAPSGASQSYKYGDLRDRWASQVALLDRLDTSGCSTAFRPADPTAPSAGIGAMVGGVCRR